MRSRLLLAGAAALMVLTAAVFLLRPAEPAAATGELTPTPLSSAEAEPVQEGREEAPWKVGIWQGYVAVFSGGKNAPDTVLEMPAAALPEADRTALEQGIPIHSREELAALLEDYGS